ncbi:MAG: hypothetical protein JSU01_08235, partial [Bacteroidetes bacterium]|nr:hypothetical protein [Bacteroidota bacterium]
MSHHLKVVKCPNEKCGAPIHLSVGHFKGGVNDKGGVIIQCDECSTVFPCPLKNPIDASGVGKNGRTLDTWIDDLPEYLETKYNIEAKTMAELSITPVFGYEKAPAVEWWPHADTFYNNGSINFEMEAVAVLTKYRKQVSDNYKSYLNLYVKGRHSADKSFVFIDYELDGTKYRATFAKQIETEGDLTPDNLYLISHSKVDLEYQIDGIFSRNQLIIFLERLLNRWRYTAHEVLLVVPFIGFNYKNAEEALSQLWEWLENNVDSEKTKLITRKGTFNLFKQAQDNSGIAFDVLVDLGLLEPFFEKLTGKDAGFFQKSHAKYYVGVFEDYVEVLSGSFNIHTGTYFENMTFKRYRKD